MTLEQLKAEALKLGRLDRLTFIQFMLETLEQEERERADVVRLTEKQKALIRDRIEAIKSGKVKTRPYQEVEENIKRKYGFDRS